MLTFIAVIVGGYVLFRIVAAIWRGFTAVTIVESWGLVLEGQAGRAAELLDHMEEALLKANTGPCYWKHHADQFLGIFTGQRQTYAAVAWKGFEAVTGAHPVGSDLYVSWNLLTRRQASKQPGQEFGLNETNDMKAFASAALGITQRVTIALGFPDGKGPPPERLMASGILGPILPPSPPRPSEARPEPTEPQAGGAEDQPGP